MHTLKVKKLDPRAKLPTVATPGEDLGYDIYALEDTYLEPGVVTKVRTGIAVEARISEWLTGDDDPAGLLIRDRSSVASQGVIVSGGVIDAGYRGEIVVVLTNINRLKQRVSVGPGESPVDYNSVFSIKLKDVNTPLYIVKAGAKIAQMIPVPVLTGDVIEVEELSTAARGEKGFGSSGAR
jgi:dUTP pyrophosphatase